MSVSRNTNAVIFVCLVGVMSVFLSGCGGQAGPSAVDLYVDAVMLNEIGESAQAIGKLEDSVELNEEFSLAHSLLGDIYKQVGDYPASESSYETATELNQWSFGDYFNLGEVRYVMEKFEKAGAAYSRACELKPQHLRAHVGATKSYYKAKDYGRALRYGRAAEEIDPDISEIQELLGDIYESQSDHEQAIASYKRALEIDSDNLDVMTSLAVAYLRSNRNEPAKELLGSVVQRQPANGTAYQYLGYCNLRLGDIDKSIESYDRAIEIDSRDWESYRGRGVA